MRKEDYSQRGWQIFPDWICEVCTINVIDFNLITSDKCGVDVNLLRVTAIFNKPV